jgi:hypothetical protein
MRNHQIKVLVIYQIKAIAPIVVLAVVLGRFKISR